MSSVMKIKGGVWGVIAPPADVPSGEATEVSQLHPRTGWITLTGDNGVLQFYDIVKDRHIKLLQVLDISGMFTMEFRCPKVESIKVKFVSGKPIFGVVVF